MVAVLGTLMLPSNRRFVTDAGPALCAGGRTAQPGR